MLQWLEGYISFRQGHTAMSQEQTRIVRQIRHLVGGTRGAQMAMLKLPDEALYALYLQLRNGVGNRACARYLQKEFQVVGAENSLQQSIGTFKKRIAPLLKTERYPVAGRDTGQTAGQRGGQTLSKLQEIEERYGFMVLEALDKAERTGVIPPDLHKHVNALTKFSKMRSQVEENVVREVLPEGIWPEEELERRADKAWVYLTDNGADAYKMSRAAQKFLEGVEQKAFELSPEEEAMVVEIEP